VIGVTVAHEGHINHAATAEALGVDYVAITPIAKESE
jgi:thiamine monophosphate synthase